MEHTVGVDVARTMLGKLVKEVARFDDVTVLTHRGSARAVLMSVYEYERLTEIRRQLARGELYARLAQARKSVADAGLDVSVIDGAIAAAKWTE
jgi:prevent-host-death family protein